LLDEGKRERKTDSVPHQLFDIIDPLDSSTVELTLRHLSDLMDNAQREEWLTLLTGGVPQEKLRWNGTLQEAYYLFNGLRKLNRDSSPIIKILTKNGGLDWVKINQVISTNYGNIQKESRPTSESVIRTELDFFMTRVIKS
tara:strand:+ start:1128 stop:1550 length:423 start_codon:yes stop_codon:yes gene_type:complete